MNRRTFVRSALSAPFLASIPTAYGRVAPEPQTPVITPPSDEFMATLPRLLELAHVPGLGIGVVNENRPTWCRYSGVANATTKVPITSDSLFPAASLGKVLFAYAALLLVDEGALALDRPLKEYLRDGAPTGEWGGRVTARHVLSHSSGLDWRRPGQPFVPTFEPGTQFRYSGGGYYLLQRCVETITGIGFEQFMQERMMKPLGMTSSTYLWRPDARARLVEGHEWDSRPFVPGCYNDKGFVDELSEIISQSDRPLADWNHDRIAEAMAKRTSSTAPRPIADSDIYPNAAYTLLTTVPDYSAFLLQLAVPRGTAPDLKPATRAEMMTPYARVNSALSWGLGWCVERDADRTFLWQWGAGYNGYFHFALVHPESRSAIVVLTNGFNGLRLAEIIMRAASGQEHPAFLWI